MQNRMFYSFNGRPTIAWRQTLTSSLLGAMSQNRVENIASQTVLYVYIYSLWEVILSQPTLGRCRRSHTIYYRKHKSEHGYYTITAPNEQIEIFYFVISTINLWVVSYATRCHIACINHQIRWRNGKCDRAEAFEQFSIHATATLIPKRWPVNRTFLLRLEYNLSKMEIAI